MTRVRWGTTKQALVDRLKPESLADLIDHFPGRLLRVPTRAELIRRQKRGIVLDRLADHSTYDEAAAAVRVSTSTAYRYAKRAG